MIINYDRSTKTNFQLRKAAQLQNALNDILLKSSFSFRDKRVFVNVVYVDLSRDLMNAKAVIDIYGLEEEQQQELVQKLNGDLIKQLRNNLAHKIRVKRLPEIIFHCPRKNEKKDRVLDIIRSEKTKFGEVENAEVSE